MSLDLLGVGALNIVTVIIAVFVIRNDVSWIKNEVILLRADRKRDAEERHAIAKDVAYLKGMVTKPREDPNA